MLGEALELAEIVKPSWPELRKQTGPLVCEGGDEETGATETAPPGSTDTETGSEESFPDFDLSSVPDDLRPDAERYAQEVKKHFQGDYTRKTQSLAEERREIERAQQLQQALRNPQVAPAVLAQLGYDEKKVLEMYGYQPEEQELSEEPDLYDEVQGIKQTLAQREAAEQSARQEEAVTDYIAEQIEALEKKEDREFDPEEHQLLDAYARQFAKEGVPDVEGAFGLLDGIVSSRQKQWIESKKTPRPPGGGRPGSRTVDLSKESEEDFVARQQAAIEQARASAQ
jgi:hypothetical protein